MAPPPRSRSAKKSAPVKVILDLSGPVADGIIDVAALEKFLHDSIKVDGKAGNLGDKVSITRDTKKINITAAQPFSKRYVKYLTKKFLKKQELRDYMRVIASAKNTYQLRYFQIDDSKEEEEADE
eukprot:TRINITY_DN16418_c0_g1_i1.p2 TRINITY_DN16418_c0_g1~~TRINITY_DN16418_c0_g1_i1.p2  ORF type:complete len:125 (-),score=46.14 TRINITY_DN16418_c0_g1_i1:177-551(-)